MANNNKITVAVNAGEMFGKQEWSTPRSQIDQYGAKGIGDGYGLISIEVGGKPVIHHQLREDRNGNVVLVVTDLEGKQISAIPLELLGLVPAA